MTTPATTNQQSTTPQNQSGTSNSQPLGAQQAPKPAEPPKPAVEAPKPGEQQQTQGEQKPGEQQKTPAQKRDMAFVASAEDVDKLLTGKGNAIVPHSAFAKIKQQFEERGKQAGQTELLKQLEAQGFKSVEEALLAAAEARRLRDEKAKKPEEPKQEKKKASFLPKNNASSKANDELVRERVQREEAQRKAEEAERRLEEERAENHMRMACMTAEVQGEEVDYVLEKLRMHVANLDEAALASFDESKWFEELRQKKPYLFRAAPTGITTGTAAVGNAPPAPKPAEVTAANVQDTKVDARKMTPEQFRKHKESLGIRKSY